MKTNHFYHRADFFITSEIEIKGEVFEISPLYNLIASPYNYFWDSKTSKPRKSKSDKLIYLYLVDKSQNKSRLVVCFNPEFETTQNKIFLVTPQILEMHSTIQEDFNEEFCRAQLTAKKRRREEVDREREEREKERRAKQEEAEKQRLVELEAVKKSILDGIEIVVDPSDLIEILEGEGLTLPLRTKGSLRRNVDSLIIREGRIVQFSISQGRTFNHHILNNLLKELKNKTEEGDAEEDEEIKRLFGA